MNSEILITSDGSHTLFVPEIDECYHSTHGAIQESRHIFIETALKQHSKTELNVLEVGFGTGLNALLALVEAERSGTTIHYCTLEKYPVDAEKALLLNYPAMIDVRYKGVFDKMHSSAWNGKVKITPFFEIEKMECDFTNFEHTSTYDIVFFDAFSPEKQPEMWMQQQFEKIYAHCNPGAILTTYCAKGVVRRALQSAGFSVERLAGPPGKREILRAIKL
jgi:tRNA U34 5-methylaminomethyl-2-thiouridine-forming methyltransferase MnmC